MSIEITLAKIDLKCPKCDHEFNIQIENDSDTTECPHCKIEFNWQLDLIIE